MSETTADELRGGLPEDDALAAAFAAAVPRRRRRDQEDRPKDSDAADAGQDPPTEEDAEQRSAEADEVQHPPTDTAAQQISSGRAPARRLRSRVPSAPAVPQATDVVIRREGGPSEQRSTQCTVNVSASVRERFTFYQRQKLLDRGSEPTNAVVVRRAVLHARRHDLFGQMLEYVRHSQVSHDEEDDDIEGLFGDVQGRRAERGRVRDTRQLPFRPSYEEIAVIDALTRGYGFGNRSEFLDAALDAFLPRLPDKRRR